MHRTVPPPAAHPGTPSPDTPSRRARPGGSPPPLRGTLEALPATGRPTILAELPPGQGDWVLTADLRDGTLDALLARVQAGIGALLPPDSRADVPPAVAPSRLLGWYLHAVASAAVVPFLHARRVPCLSPRSLTVHLAPTGRPDAVALLSPAFTCLPRDPAVEHPHATPVPDLEALRHTLRTELGAHATTFLDAWGRRGRRGRRTHWAMLSDALVKAVVTAAPGPTGVHEATGLLPPGRAEELAPFVVGAAAFRWDTLPDGTTEPRRRKVSCCLSYTVPGDTACSSCPRGPFSSSIPCAGPGPRNPHDPADPTSRRCAPGAS